MLVRPHGSSELKPLLAPSKVLSVGKQIQMSSRELSDLLMFGMGAYTPLNGFMGEADWRGVCDNMQMDDGLFWPLPDDQDQLFQIPPSTLGLYLFHIAR